MVANEENLNMGMIKTWSPGHGIVRKEEHLDRVA